MEAISHGLTVLSWYENYQSEEIPPETIWDDAEGIEKWFKEIRRKNKERFENPGSSKPTDDDDDSGEGDNSMIGNEFADAFKR